jgi:putative sterol carrier protein
MAYFKDADDVYATLGRFIREMAADPELAPALKRADTAFQLRLRQPDSILTVGVPQDEQPSQVDFGDTQQQPEVVLQMDADTAHRFWLGDVNVAVALARGDVRARGPVAKILKIVPLVKPGFQRYRAQLQADGREDLLAGGAS